MNKKNIILVLVLLAFIVAFFVWRQIRPGTSPDIPLQKVTLQLKWLHQSQFAGFYAATQRGFYRDEGLDVSIIQVGSDLSEPNVINRVVKGDVQFAEVGGDQVIIARAAGKPIKAVSVIYQESPVVLASLKNSGIKDINGLVGKRVAVEVGQNTYIVYRAMLNKAKIPKSKIKEVTAPLGLEALAEGKADARMIYLINEGLEISENGQALSMIYPEDYDLHIYADTLVTSDSLIDQNPDLVQRFVRASLKGWNWAVANPEEAGSLVLSYDPNLRISHEVDMMKASLPLIYTGIAPIGDMDAGVWGELENVLLDQHIIKSHVPLEDIFTTKFLHP